MIIISWLWIPFIVTIILSFLTLIFEGMSGSPGFLSFLTVIAYIISGFIYIIYGIFWMFEHVTII